MSKIIAGWLAGVALAASWWIFSLYPTIIDDKGISTVNPLIVIPFILSLTTMIFVCFLISDNWNN